MADWYIPDPETAQLVEGGSYFDPNLSYYGPAARAAGHRAIDATGRTTPATATGGGPSSGAAPGASGRPDRGTLRLPDTQVARLMGALADARAARDVELVAQIEQAIIQLGPAAFGLPESRRGGGFDLNAFLGLGSPDFGIDASSLVSGDGHGQGRGGYNAYTMRGGSARRAPDESQGDDPLINPHEGEPADDSSHDSSHDSSDSADSSGHLGGGFTGMLDAVLAALYGFDQGTPDAGNAGGTDSGGGESGGAADGGTGGEDDQLSVPPASQPTVSGGDEDDHDDFVLTPPVNPLDPPSEEPGSPDAGPTGSGPLGSRLLPGYLAREHSNPGPSWSPRGPGANYGPEFVSRSGGRPFHVAVGKADEPERGRPDAAAVARSLRAIRQMPGPGRDPRSAAAVSALAQLLVEGRLRGMKP